MSLSTDALRALSPAERRRLLSSLLAEGHGPRTAPLSFAQRRLWLLGQLDASTTAYVLSSALRLEGELDVGALERAIGELIRRHEALRTTFATVDGEPVQVIAPAPRQWSLPQLDLSELPREEAWEEARRRVDEEARRPFDLQQGPLFRALVLRLRPEEHVLCLCMHHIVSDGWSTGLLLEEISVLYRAAIGGRVAGPPPAPQYADWVLRQREQLSREVLDEAAGWWKRTLQGAPKLLELPTDRPRPSIRRYRGERMVFEVPEEVRDRLVHLGRSHDATLFMVLFAAFSVLLHRYSGQRDIVIGTPIAGRERREYERTVGLFVNTVPLRAEVTSRTTFSEVLRRARDVVLEAFAHQHLPFEKIVEALQPERALSHAPVIQVMLAFQNATRPRLDLPGVRAEPVSEGNGASKLDLTLSLEEMEGRGLWGAFIYDPDLFDRATITRMASHFGRLLERITDGVRRPVGDLPLLSETEIQREIACGSGPRAPVPGRCLHDVLADIALHHPEAPAVLCGGRLLTYAQLDARANQLARYLRRLGVGPDTRVGISMERSIEMIVSLWGVLKAGGAYVPLDAVYPRERLAYVLEDSACQVLLVHGANVDGLGRNGARTVDLGKAGAEIDLESTVPLSSEQTTPDHLAYVLYTSGSTGRPKGVAIPHRQLLNYATAYLDRLRLGTGASFAMVQPFAFDSAGSQIFGAVLSAGCLHVVSEAMAVDPDALADTFRTAPPDCLKIVPSHLAALLNEQNARDILPRGCLVVGGEGARPQWTHGLHALQPGIQIFNHYGPTETTIGVAMYAVDPEHPESRTSTLPLGSPISNVQGYVLDEHLNPIPPGVVGELYLGGACIARGYLNRPRLTAERFVPDPFTDQPGGRLYRTGDRARRFADGTLEFLGRLDQQVKIRGFRIELGDIESALRAVTNVRDALAMTSGETDPRILAYVVGMQSELPEGTEIRESLRSSLPEYMIPDAVLVLSEFPRAPNGKLDRAALPIPARSVLETGDYVAPRSDLERRLARHWADVLGLARVGIHDNFFDLGGHSLLATRLVSRLRYSFDVAVPLRTLLEKPTIAEISSVLDPEVASEPGAPQRIPRLRR